MVYTWESDGVETKIYGTQYEDLLITQKRPSRKGQMDLGGNSIEPQENFLCAHYDYWPVLTAISLKFANGIGVKIPESIKWKKFLKENKWDEEIRMPLMGEAGYGNFLADFNGKEIAELPDKTSMKKLEANFFGIMHPDCGDNEFIPVMDEDRNLVFCADYKTDKYDNGIQLAPYGEFKDYYPLIIIPKADVSHLFKGSVHGIMTGESRTSSSALAYMLWEHKELLKGRPENEIRSEGNKKYF